MIPGSRFSGALRYFESIYDDTTEASERQRIATEVGAESFDGVRQAFLTRLAQSRARLAATQTAIRPAAEAMDDPAVDPRESTAELSSRYTEILGQLPGR
ncbi:MAG: hypothetical protein JRH11_24385 [Deltaproteobacteria bacterium]|nr:hypothetical protein [Deltaproteobacteria bacterium]